MNFISIPEAHPLKIFASLILPAVLFIHLEQANAMQPPPFDRRKIETDRAMDALTPFLGRWKKSARRGTDDGPVRNLWRQGNVILYVISGDEPALINIISYDPWERHYLLHLAGYRNTYISRARELVHITRPNPNTIQWVFPYARLSKSEEPADIFETISIEKGKWHENLVFRRTGKPPTKIQEVVLERVGPATIEILKSR